jgi:lipopolysaccharide transport system ATP-binding protein
MSKSASTVLELKNVGFTYSSGIGFYGGRRIEALRDISFTIQEGETVGLIGRNGCGKSTLLRLITGIFTADRGDIIRNCDRIALLALSVGFDRALTGSQNLILSCMFLGASRREAQSYHDDIVEFAGLEDFINDPLKTYSSGMRARLGFSIGMRMNADLMLIDEVLGVGDTAFRNKAQAAMKSKINSDQSVLFVSHSMGSVVELCQRVIWLEDGVVRALGEPEKVVDAYQEFMQTAKGVGNRAGQKKKLSL